MYQLDEMPFMWFLLNILKTSFPTGFVQVGHIWCYVK